MTDAQDWPLQHVVEYLRSFPLENADDYGLAGVYLGLVDMDGSLTPAGTALLAVLDVEDCKRRIEAANGGYSHLVSAPGLCDISARPQHGPWVYFHTWRAATEYAEAHAQEAETDG